ncbi:nucleolar complex protein 3 homolog [Ostrinia furnacalis]|uniref:nucleolar complex protein 3 homolog n=1 Tax=Ostrinia furnacalis TaxID=93504 RepID=UPI00103CBA20|nr:nucleolar complex protein 3 homolog [Ostrinia furnacalis]
MAKKGKMKISKVKRNNHTTNKMRKQGTLRLQRHRAKVQKQKQPQQSQEVEYSSESDSASGEEWADMLDADEQQYIMQRLATQPSLLSNVPEKEQVQRSKKRKREDKGKVPKRQQQNSDSGAETDDDSDSELEDKYEKELSENPAKRMRPLLPIKTKHGLLERAEEVEDTESEQEESYQEEEPSKEEEQPQESESDSGMEGTVEDNEAGDGETISAVQLLAARRDKLQHDKLRIGALCSSLLESPENKLKNFFPILYLMEERLKDNTLNLHSVRKLATLSAYEVFKDILPDYMIRHQDYSNIKLKKDTLALYKYEKELVEFYKRYLQRLEKAAMVLRRKKGDTKKPDEPTISLALVSLRCMCGMLEARPQFNYAANIAQSVVPYLDCREDQAREIVTECCRTVFGEDQKGEITLAIVRLINQLVKRRGERLHPAALDCLLSLRIRDVDMDAAADLQHKKKQDSKHKKRIVNLSKKEKKRAKKLKEVERELLETEAQESELARRKQLTEVTKTVFHVYFRLLKTAPRSRLLAAALSGLTKFTHVINMEYYSDLVAILSRLVEDELIGPRERLLCVRTVLGVLAGAGDALTVDPAKFHQHLYASAIGVHAGASQSDARIVLEAVWQICSRARRVSPAVLQAFAKRLATLAAQTQHHAALAALALLQQLAQQSKAVSNLLEPDSEAGSGRFEPLLPSPEHCNAHAAALHELCAMRTHYHLVVRQQAAALMQAGNVAELNKLSPLQIFDAYDGSQMAFKPAIPPPKSDKPKSKSVNHGHTWVQNDFKTLCENVENSVDLVIKNSNR